MSDKQSIYRQGFGLVFSVFVFLLCIFTLEKTGVPRGYSITLTAAALIVLWGIVVLLSGTTSAHKFFLSAKNSRSTVNALAMTSHLAFPVLIGSGGGLLFLNPAMFIAMVAGTTIGAAFSSMLISRPFHESGASDICSLLDQRYGNSSISKFVSLVLLIGSIGLGAIGIYYATLLTSWFFMLSAQSAFIIIMSATLISAFIGGSHSATRLAAIAAVVLVVGVNLPLIIQSISANGFPFGQITFGTSALTEMWDLEDQLRSLGIPLLENVVTTTSALAAWSGGDLVAVGLVIATGVAFFPTLTHQYAMTDAAEKASQSATRLIVFVGFVGVSLFALLFFSKFSLYQTILGLSVSEARISAPFLFSWSGRSADLVVLCGKMLANEAGLLNACRDGSEHILSIQDLQFNGNLLLAASPDLSGLPFAFTALLTCGIILTLVSFASAILLSTSNNVVSAFFSSLTAKVASSKIFISRLTIIILGFLAGAICLFFQFDTLKVFLLSMSILATICAPSLIGALWLKQSTAISLATAISVGLAITILYYVLAGYGIDFKPGNGDELQLVLPGMTAIIPPELSAIYGVPFALIILFGSAVYSDMLKPEAAQSE